MTKQEIDQFLDLYSKMDNLGRKVYEYMMTKYPQWLKGGYGSEYAESYMDEFTLQIQYYNGDTDDSIPEEFDVPYEVVIEGWDSIETYLDEYVIEKINESKKLCEQYKTDREKVEYAEYLRLKEKFEN